MNQGLERAKNIIIENTKIKKMSLKETAEDLAAVTFWRMCIAEISQNKRCEFLEHLENQHQDKTKNYNLDMKNTPKTVALNHSIAFSQKISPENFGEFMDHYKQTLKDLIKKEV